MASPSRRRSKRVKAVGDKTIPLSRTAVARTVFVQAATMGISDRNLIEEMVDYVISHLERSPVLPGMEELISRPQHPPRLTVGEAEITALMSGFLSQKKPVKEEKSKMVRSKTGQDESLKLSENAVRVLERRYLKKDEQGRVIETPQEMFRRVARTVASAELLYNPVADTAAMEETFYRLMTNLEFLPNSPTLMNAGRELGQLSACFVLPVDDSMPSIFEAVKNTALIHQSGGGTGFSFSRLRPEKDRVGSTGGVASGPVSFMRVFDTATDVIKQGGTRRGANMAILNIDHPDIMKFITVKDDPAVLTNFNLSVAVTGAFMEKVKSGDEYALINPRTKAMAGRLKAGDVFGKIVEMAWKMGDPGMVFLDRINQDNPTPHLGMIESTNPCGEQPLLPYESCNLGSINLSRMLKKSGGRFEIDYERLEKVTRTAVRFLDNVIDANRFPLPQIKEMTRSTRKIGLGIMGFADVLIIMGVPYNSEEALRVAEEVMGFINRVAHEASEELGAERGVFQAYEGSIYDRPGGPKIRNATTTTIAPTGTLSLIAGCSSGIEPLFALSYTRNILDGARLSEANPYFEEAARAGGFYSPELMEKLASGARLSEIEGIPDDIRKVFVTAHEISPEWHVRMQAAFQKYVDNAVSKTVNFPRTATREDVARVFMLAYESGLKGITVYRDGSREGQVLTAGEKPVKAGGVSRTPRKRSKVTSGFTERVTTGCGYIYVTVNSDENGVCEVFSTLGKAGGCASAQLEAISRLISLSLRSGIGIASIAKQLRGIRCPSIAWEEGKAVLSCADAIANVLEKQVKEKEDAETASSLKAQADARPSNIAGQCPDCGQVLIYQEGCFVCPGCGYTKC